MTWIRRCCKEMCSAWASRLISGNHTYATTARAGLAGVVKWLAVSALVSGVKTVRLYSLVAASVCPKLSGSAVQQEPGQQKPVQHSWLLTPRPKMMVS